MWQILTIVFLISCFFAQDLLDPNSHVSVEKAIEILEEMITGEALIHDFCHKHPGKYSHELFTNKEISFGSCTPMSSCAELFIAGHTASGIYTIYPKPWMQVQKMQVYCDMENDGGGWTVFQRRGQYDGRQINFNRNYKDYTEGFGQFETEYWIGNDNLHVLTTQENVALRINFKDFDGNEKYAEYARFRVSGRKTHYNLTVGGYQGDAGNGLDRSNGALFQVFQNESIKKECNNVKQCPYAKCAEQLKSGWWYKNCTYGNLNGENIKGHPMGMRTISWPNWTGTNESLAFVEMKIRPKKFDKFLNDSLQV